MRGPAGKRRGFTKAELRKLVKLGREGRPAKELAWIFDTSDTTIRRRLRSLGIDPCIGPRVYRRKEITPEQDLQLRAMHAAGATRAEIGAQLRCTGHTITRLLSDRGLLGDERRGNQRRIWTQAQADEIASLWQQGWGIGALVQHFKTSKSSIDQVLNARGLHRPAGRSPRELTEEQVAVIVKLRDKGWSQEKIAKRVGCSQGTVSERLRLSGLGLEAPIRRHRENHPFWKGGRIVGAGGYTLVLLPRGHPLIEMANISGYVPEHRLVMAQHIGRALTRKETVHHKDGNRTNNDIENLQLRQSQHGKGVVLRCRHCGSYDVGPAPIG